MDASPPALASTCKSKSMRIPPVCVGAVRMDCEEEEGTCFGEPLVRTDWFGFKLRLLPQGVADLSSVRDEPTGVVQKRPCM